MIIMVLCIGMICMAATGGGIWWLVTEWGSDSEDGDNNSTPNGDNGGDGGCYYLRTDDWGPCAADCTHGYIEQATGECVGQTIIGTEKFDCSYGACPVNNQKPKKIHIQSQSTKDLTQETQYGTVIGKIRRSFNFNFSPSFIGLPSFYVGTINGDSPPWDYVGEEAPGWYLYPLSSLGDEYSEQIASLSADDANDMYIIGNVDKTQCWYSRSDLDPIRIDDLLNIFYLSIEYFLFKVTFVSNRLSYPEISNDDWNGELCTIQRYETRSYAHWKGEGFLECDGTTDDAYILFRMEHLTESV